MPQNPASALRFRHRSSFSPFIRLQLHCSFNIARIMKRPWYISYDTYTLVENLYLPQRRFSCRFETGTTELSILTCLIPLTYFLSHEGKGIPKCLQMRVAVNSGISRCRGTEARRFVAGFSQIECSAPSLTSRQPC